MVSVDKIVTKQCHNSVFFSAVQDAAPDCFNACGTDKTNSSSPCWAECFYGAVLGPGGTKPGGAITGIPLDTLITTWLKPFASNDTSAGGCPSVPQFEEGAAFDYSAWQ